MVDANQGWRMAGRPRRRAGTSRPRPRAPARSSRSACYWLEEPLPDRRRRGLRARCGARTGAADRGRRDGAHARTRRATSCCAAASTCCSPTCVLCGRARRLPPDRRAGRPAAARMFSPHTWSNGLRAGREPAPRAARSRRARTSRCRSTRRPGRPSGATGCCPRRSRSPPTARSRRRPGPGLGVEPDLDALERVAGGMSGRSPSAPPCSTDGRAARGSRSCELDAAARRRGAGARRRGRRLPLRPAPGGRPPRRRALADGARPRGRRRRRGGRRGRRRTVAPGDRVAFCFVPACGSCPRVPGRAGEPVRAPRRRAPRPARCWTAAPRLRLPDGATSSTSSTCRVLRRALRRRRRARRAGARRRCRCGRRRCSAAAW